MQENPGCVVTKYNFQSSFQKHGIKLSNQKKLISGFFKCGIRPFNPEAPIHPTNSQNDDDNERMNQDGEMEVVTADAARDSSGKNYELEQWWRKY